MKRLPKMLCALILCALMVTAAVSCGQKPAQQLQDPPQQEDPQPAPALKIAVDSEPARSAVIHWFYSEEGQALFGDTDPDDVIFSVDPRDIAQELKLGNYDAAVCAPDQKALQLLGGYESMPLLKDAVIFAMATSGRRMRTITCPRRPSAAYTPAPPPFSGMRHRLSRWFPPMAMPAMPRTPCGS